MKFTINRQAWVNKNEVNERELKDRLVVYRKDPLTKELERMQMWEETATQIGMPRQYPFLVLGGGEIEDDTVWQPCEFPDFHGTLRPGQQEAIQDYQSKLKEWPYGGVLQAKCGTGKTVVALYLASIFKVPTIVLVHKSDLMNQWKERIEQFLPGCKVGIVRQNKQDFRDKHIVIAMMATVWSRVDELREQGFFEYFSLLIEDEIHHVPASTFSHVIRQFSPKIKIGLSATCRRNDGLDDIIFWHTGPILTKMQGAVVTGQYMQLKWHNPSLGRWEWSIAKAITILSQDPGRNELIANAAIAAVERGRKILILTDRVAHAKFLADVIEKKLVEKGKAPSVSTYLGEMTQLQLTAARTKQVIAASFGMIGEATDLPEADTLFFATPRGDIEQTVGRIQRVCEGKKEPVIIDVVDTGLGLFIGLSKKRRKMYDKLGFKETQ